ncbi:AAA domain (dynein-related subfamily) [Streptomyces sp. 3213]|uniref:AAA family ATPase n=1 Tax=Streptomyces sp. 3213.3 TaxID=1855348 RepID=UPI00089C1D04|nr:AAA family ATPase [Streptomyces sp. 3213.3]SEE80781.1 AAA domain (dynein-related subfamily) [Streptomyces sp. 3213] [Streptomyces sp. 3213.3]
MSTETGQLTTPAAGRDRREPSRLESFIDAMIDLGQTGQIFGEHGIGKTATFFSHIGRAHPGTALVYVPAANLTPDDLLINAPVRDPHSGELVLRQLVMSQLKPGTPFVLLIDDSLQAGDTIQSQLMQIACNWTLGEHDLRALGCVGVFLTDNESLTETSARRGDLALLDRMVTMRITANDTSWRRHLAAKYRPWDLNPVFAVWASLSPTLRELLSPRTLDHVLANAKEGFPLRWGLPLIDGERLRLAEPGPDGKPGQNRTAEILDRLAQALGVPNPATVPDPVRQVVRAALRNRWTVLLQGPPGCGKTELVRETVRAGLGREPLYFSLPVTNVEDLCAPIPSPDGTLDNLLAANFTGPDPKAIVWDEYNRPKDKATFAKLMEITQEWSLAGRRIENLRAQIAVQNPPYHLGRKLLVSRNNIAQATRFTASLTVEPEDIPANEWLLARYGADAETVLEWWKHDIDDDGRAWITKRTLERLIKLHRKGLPLEMATVYLGDGEYAPVPLTALIDRFKGRPVTGLRELARDADQWEARLRRAADHTDEGGDDSDVVHQILANAELSQLKKHRAVVARMVALLPAKLRATYLVGASAQQQRFWTDIFTGMARR